MLKKSQCKIGIDARFFGPQQKGLGRYVQKLVENLEGVDFNNQYIIFLRQENFNDFQPKNQNFKKVLADYKWYSLKEQIFFPFKIWQAQVDLMHFPHFNLPLMYFGPYLVTIHDLVLKRYPTRKASTLGPVLYWFKNLAYKLVIASAVKRAKKIIAVSEFTKNDIIQYFKIKPDKIKVIYEGSPINQITNSKLQIPNKLQIPKNPYLLYVGNAYPHKNLERLILAFDRLVREKTDLRLILVGELDYFYQKLKNNLLSYKLHVTSYKRIVFTDFVSDQELTQLYQNASLYVFPSLCEGFGLPPLEAMAHNLPVVCSRATCLPEILGEAAMYFNPEDINDMVFKIKQVLENKQVQDKLIEEGRKKIKEYQWQKMVQEILGLYQK